MSKLLPPTILGRWIPLALLCTGLILVTHVAVQQAYRQSANDPQIQMAEDAATALNQGATPASLVTQPKIDREHSLAPFIVIITKQHQIAATSASYGSDSSLPPSGIFGAVDTQGEQRFTWQTQQGVRYAAVVTADNNGYVLAARSLKEVESREHDLTTMAGIALVGLLVLTFLSVIVIR